MADNSFISLIFSGRSYVLNGLRFRNENQDMVKRELQGGPVAAIIEQTSTTKDGNAKSNEVKNYEYGKPTEA